MKKLTRKALLGIVLALIMVLGIPATMNEAEARTSRLDFADPNEEDEVTIYLTADQMYKPYTLTAPEVTNTNGDSLIYDWEGIHADAGVYEYDSDTVAKLGSGKTVTVIPAQCTFAVVDISCDNGYVYKMYAFVQVSYAGQRDGMVRVGDNWMYMVDGEPVNYTGMASNEYGWWYYKDGFIDFTYTGLACNEYGWWYFRNGQIDFNYTGLVQNEYGWWYVRNGAVDFNYTGLVYDQNVGWWYVQNGAINFNYNGLVCDSYVGWWVVSNGAVNFGYTGMIANEYGWWFAVNGTLDFNATGWACNEYGWWLYYNGTIAWNYTGWWDGYYCVNGHLA